MNNLHAYAPITLDNCAREPIHIPGSIQPHGALLVFDPSLQLMAWSANVSSLLGIDPQLNQSAESLDLNSEIYDVLREVLQDIADGEAHPMVLEINRAGIVYDVVIHAHLNRIIVEFEHRDIPTDEVATFAIKAHRAIDRLKRQKSINSLLQMAVEQVKELTGFDRVMAYRFRYDDSGDVVAEKCNPDLDHYIGRRYPASDIPAQARRLYTINTLRLIADINYQLVPILASGDDAPLDMSHCVLRSVSPIHIEYLKNMGVGASMSISIIVKGKLWGMLACHHMSPLKIPYSIRMACDVLAQIIASTVASLQEYKRAELMQQAASVRAALVETLLHEEDVLRALAKHAESLQLTLGADALIVTQHGKSVVIGKIDAQLASKIVSVLPACGDDLILWQSRSEWPAALQTQIKEWVGLLALNFDPATRGWILAFRLEQIETIVWGGRPEKEVQAGPLGSRLTPRGSFDEWRETVRDSAEPWEEIRIEAAKELLNSMLRATNLRHAETDRARAELLAILGHDLRDPLHTINMASHVWERGGGENKMGQRIRASSSRMQRLVGQVLDLSRLGSGIGLGIEPVETNVGLLVTDLVDDALIAHPDMRIDLSVPEFLSWPVDPDRLTQAIGNLLSNSRIHGIHGAPIKISLAVVENKLLIEVSNEADAIEPELAEQLFSAFKKSSSSKVRSGLGLGLYIAQEIIGGHNGLLTYRYQAPYVIFSITLTGNLKAVADGENS